MIGPIEPFNEKKADPSERTPSSCPISKKTIPYADCIFRDGYVGKNEWDNSWLRRLNEKPWKTNRVYANESQEYKVNRVIIGIFLDTKELHGRPDLVTAIEQLDEKFLYLLGQFSTPKGSSIRFTPLEWIALRRLEERCNQIDHHEMKQIFLRHFGTDSHEGEEFKNRMEAAIQEVRGLVRNCLTLDHVKEDLRGLLFHAKLEEISRNEICIENMAKKHFHAFQSAIENALLDLREFRVQFHAWNEENKRKGIKV